MKTEDKQFVLLEHLDEFRRWTYDSLSAEIKRMPIVSDCLAHSEGVFLDGTAYQVELNVFWDDRPGGNIRVMADLTTVPRNSRRSFYIGVSPDLVDSFIMRRDGTFVGE